MESNVGLREQDLLLMVWQQAERISSTTINILFDIMEVCIGMYNIKRLCRYEDHYKRKRGKNRISVNYDNILNLRQHRYI